MTRLFSFLALFFAAALCVSAADDSHHQDTGSVRPPLAGYHADMKVSADGVTRHGRLIVTRDGGIHLEHFDEPTRRRAAEIICRAYSPLRGWNDRTEPARLDWLRLGRDDVLAEIHTPDATIKLSRHQLLSSR